ncbi:MAG: 23S rRNA (guanosine(2251)-2'-O)-methyltransferase RlmB [Bacteroidales bacterium]|nr:23S rRNA (guanosine(2251)-2'-O)-methyltransferase RlmB [Bacteroidales bacterium]
MNKYTFGVHAVREAIISSLNINKIFVKKSFNSQIVKEIIGLARSKNIPVQYVPEEKLNRITNGNHQGIVALNSPIEYSDIEQILLETIESGIIPFLFILDGITDVRNFGAIARTCEAAGCQCILIPEVGAAGISPDAIKASAGALNHIPVCRYKHIKDIISLLHQYGLIVVGASEKANSFIYDYNFKEPIAIILGGEGKGLSNVSIKNTDILLKLPMFGKIASLNVSASAAIFAYEVVRQRL